MPRSQSGRLLVLNVNGWMGLGVPLDIRPRKLQTESIDTCMTC